MTAFVAARTSQSRVFVAAGKPGPKNPPVFQGCLVMGGASQSQGDVTYIYCPDPENYDRFVKVGEIIGREDNVETSLSGHFPRNQRSQISKWAKAKTSLAVHVHWGEATNPQNFNVFEKAIIFDDGARITSTDIDEMGSLEESNPVGESADISASSYYEVVPMTYVARVDNLVDAPATGCAVATIYDENLPLDNRSALYVVLDDTLVYSVDGGENWDTIALTAGAVGVAVVNDVPVIINDTTGNTYYVDVLGGETSPTTVTNAQNLTCIASVAGAAYVGGPAGYFGVIDDYTSSPTELTLGTSDAVLSVHALTGGVILAGTDGGYVFYSVDGTNFGSYLLDVAQSVTAVCAVNDEIFWAGLDNGEVYFSVDGGNTWELRNFPGSGSGEITGISFPTLSVGFIAQSFPAVSEASLLKTVGAGASGTWYSVPRSGSLPTAYNLKIATIKGEPNLLLGCGENSGATDGVAIVGTGA